MLGRRRIPTFPSSPHRRSTSSSRFPRTRPLDFVAYGLLSKSSEDPGNPRPPSPDRAQDARRFFVSARALDPPTFESYSFYWNLGRSTPPLPPRSASFGEGNSRGVHSWGSFVHQVSSPPFAIRKELASDPDCIPPDTSSRTTLRSSGLPSSFLSGSSSFPSSEPERRARCRW